MSYIDPDEFRDKDISLVYVAGTTSEAKGIEKLFTNGELSYTLVEVPFLHSPILGATIELPGVGFYVLTAQASYCRKLLETNEYRKGLILEGEE